MTPDERLDQLLRADLTRRESAVDAGPLRRRLRARLTGDAPVRRARWAFAAAAAVVVGLLMFGGSTPVSRAQTTPEQVLAEARAVNAEAVKLDRHYAVRTDWLGAPPPALAFRPTRTLDFWTRGDRFVLKPRPGEPLGLTWGRDETKHLWVAPGPRVGMYLEDSEVPDGIRLSVEMFNLELDTLLNEMLQRFRLKVEPSDPGNDRIRAVARLPKTMVSEIVIDIDHVTKTVRRLEIHRRHFDGFRSIVTYELLEQVQRPDTFYQLAGNVESKAFIIPKGDGPARQRFLQRLKPKI